MGLLQSAGTGAAAGAAAGPVGAIAGAAIGALGSIANGIIGNKGARDQRAWEEKQAAIQRDWNEQMMDKQNAFNVDMWNRTNEYNDPSNQVARMTAAGLNPLYYGLDGSSANGIESAQSLGYERPSGGVSPFTAGAAGVTDTALKFAQLENIRSQTAKNNNENVTETQRRENLATELRSIQADIALKAANKSLSEQQAKNLELANSWVDRLNQANMEYTQSQKALSDSQKKRVEELLLGEKLNQVANLVDFVKKWEKIEAEIKKMSKETGLLQKDIDNYALNHAQSGILGSGFSIPNIIRGVTNFTKSAPAIAPEDAANDESLYEKYDEIDG